MSNLQPALRLVATPPATQPYPNPVVDNTPPPANVYIVFKFGKRQSSWPGAKRMNKTRLLILPVIVLLLAQSSSGQSPVFGEFIDAYAKAHDFSGTILVRKGAGIAYARSFGMANRQHQVPNKVATKYRVASITKAFTAVLILRLYEQGRLDLHRTIKTYLPDYAGEAGDKVTVHQLLNHTAGMANIDRNITSAESAIKNGIPHYQMPLTTEQLLAKYCSESLVSEPGKVFDYNNADYIILGKIIERVRGKTYEQVLGEDILRPLAMRDSGMLYQHAVLGDLADTYFFRDDLKRLANDLPVYIENWYAAGAMYSTAHDLLKFSDALFGAKLLRPETLALMLKPGLDDYGYGVWAYETRINNEKHPAVKRPGRIMGAQSMLFHLPRAGATIIILSNTDATNLDEFAAEMGKRLIDADPGGRRGQGGNRPNLRIVSRIGESPEQVREAQSAGPRHRGA